MFSACKHLQHVCGKLTRNEIEALPVLCARFDLAGEQVELDRLPVGLQTQAHLALQRQPNAQYYTLNSPHGLYTLKDCIHR